MHLLQMQDNEATVDFFSCYCFSVLYQTAELQSVITSGGDGQIMRTDHNAALPGKDSNNICGKSTVVEREKKTAAVDMMVIIVWWWWLELSYNRLKSKQKDIQNEAPRIRLQSAFVV